MIKRILLFAGLLFGYKTQAQPIELKPIYDFQVKNIKGKEIALSEYKGKVILIVNVASKCGLTPQYEGLEALYEKYKDKGLVILGFPCNQFLKQEPGTETEIAQFCQLNYGVSFPLFAKIDVNGEKADPLYKYLKSALPGKALNTEIEWNFAKFLINKEGIPVKRFLPTVKPQSLEQEIEALLK